MDSQCMCCRKPVYRGFLCRGCWYALAGLREIWAADGRTFIARPRSAPPELVELYRERIASRQGIFEPMPTAKEQPRDDATGTTTADV